MASTGTWHWIVKSKPMMTHLHILLTPHFPQTTQVTHILNMSFVSRFTASFVCKHTVAQGKTSVRHLVVEWNLTPWGRVTHICVSRLTTIDSDNGLSPGRRQAITWTNVGILLIWPLGTNFNEMLIEIHTFSFKKIHLKISSGKWRPFCLDLNVLNDRLMTDHWTTIIYHKEC